MECTIVDILLSILFIGCIIFVIFGTFYEIKRLMYNPKHFEKYINIIGKIHSNYCKENHGYFNLNSKDLKYEIQMSTDECCYIGKIKADRFQFIKVNDYERILYCEDVLIAKNNHYEDDDYNFIHNQPKEMIKEYRTQIKLIKRETRRLKRLIKTIDNDEQIKLLEERDKLFKIYGVEGK